MPLTPVTDFPDYGTQSRDLVLVNAEDQPFFTDRDGASQVGFFYLDPKDALSELRNLQQRSASASAKLKLVTLSELYFPFIEGEQEVGEKWLAGGRRTGAGRGCQGAGGACAQPGGPTGRASPARRR